MTMTPRKILVIALKATAWIALMLVCCFAIANHPGDVCEPLFTSACAEGFKQRVLPLLIMFGVTGLAAYLK